MGQLFDKIRSAVRADRYFFGDHADNALRDRKIEHWQIIEGIEAALILSERPATRPNPSVEAEQVLADGTTVKVVWAHIASLDLAKLVTVHFIDR